MNDPATHADMLQAALIRAARAAVAYDKRIQREAAAESWIESPELDALYDEWTTAAACAVALLDGVCSLCAVRAIPLDGVTGRCLSCTTLTADPLRN